MLVPVLMLASGPVFTMRQDLYFAFFELTSEKKGFKMTRKAVP